jgi:TetR/AcrR family transcriptional regulator, regulator of cefoperazone and chloramphenicol sensitivity
LASEAKGRGFDPRQPHQIPLFSQSCWIADDSSIKRLISWQNRAMSPTSFPPLCPSSSAQRSDGEQTRERLLLAGLKLFSEKGYAQTTTREIAAQAQANIGAIAYYFEGKAGLYRTLYNTPILHELGHLGPFQMNVGGALDLLAQDRQAWLRGQLTAFYGAFTEPLKCSELARMCTRLHMREMIDPTGVVGLTDDCVVVRHHHAATVILSTYFDQPVPDEQMLRLVHAVVAMGMYLYVGRDVTEQLTPTLMANEAALDVWRDQLVAQGVAVILAAPAADEKKAGRNMMQPHSNPNKTRTARAQT